MGQTDSKSFANVGGSANIYKEVDNYQRNAERRIILIGKTGTGKSTLGNAILDYQFFKNEGVQMHSNTTQCQVGRGKSFDGKDVVVLDTPGLMDTKRDKKEIIEELCKCTAIMAPGPHTICLVIRGDERFTEENVDTLDEFCAFFGEDIYKHLIVVFTHKASMGKSTTADDCLGALPKEFVTKFLTAGGKKIAIESTGEKKQVKKQIKELFKLMEEIIERNDDGFYSEDKFKAAEEAFRKRIPKIQQEVEKLFEIKKKSLEDEYQHKANQFKDRENELEEKLQQAKQKFEQEKQLRENEKREKEASADEVRKWEEKQQKKMKSIEEKLAKEREEKKKIKEDYERNMKEVNAKSVRKLQATIVEDRGKAREAVTESKGFGEMARDVVKEGAGMAYDVVVGGVGKVIGGIASWFW